MVFECAGGGESHKACCGSLLRVTKTNIGSHRDMDACCKEEPWLLWCDRELGEMMDMYGCFYRCKIS